MKCIYFSRRIIHNYFSDLFDLMNEDGQKENDLEVPPSKASVVLLGRPVHLIVAEEELRRGTILSRKL